MNEIIGTTMQKVYIIHGLVDDDDDDDIIVRVALIYIVGYLLCRSETEGA